MVSPIFWYLSFSVSAWQRQGAGQHQGQACPWGAGALGAQQTTKDFLVPLSQVTVRARSQGTPSPRAGLEDKRQGQAPREQLGHPQSGGTQRDGHRQAPQHSKDLAESSEQQPLHLVGVNTPGSKASPSQTP